MGGNAAAGGKTAGRARVRCGANLIGPIRLIRPIGKSAETEVTCAAADAESAETEEGWYAAASLVAQGFDGVEAGSFPGGIKTENDADGSGDRDGGEHAFGTGFDRPLEMGLHHQSGTASEQDPDDTADQTQQDRFNQKLLEDVAGTCADGHAQADLARAFGHGDQHDVHDADAADHEGDQRHAEQQVRHERGRLVQHGPILSRHGCTCLLLRQKQERAA